MSDTASPGARVFATAELLEAILLEADIHTVLLAQRVNCFFQACIRGSSKLQEKLFLRKLPASSTVEWQKDETHHNPLLFSHNRAIPSDSMKHIEHYKHSYVRMEGMNGSCELSRHKKDNGDEVLFLYFSDFHLGLLRKTLATQQPSFLDMYLCRTVSPKVEIRVWKSIVDGLDVDWAIVKAQAHIGTFGQLLEVAMSMQEAAKSLAHVESQKQYEERDKRMYEPKWAVEPSEDFDWKEHFGRLALQMLEGTPKFLLC